MTIKELATKLDDYSGTLSMEVEKLQIERTRGTLGPDEQLDLVGDLREAVMATLIRPWRVKTFWGTSLGLLFLAASLFLPPGIPNREIYLPVAIGLSALAFLLSGYGIWMLLKYRKSEGLLLRKAEEAVRKGGTVFDVT